VLGRPNAALACGIEGAVVRLRGLADAAVAAIPAGRGAAALGALIQSEMQRLLPAKLAQKAA
jgi:hypothetical protein